MLQLRWYAQQISLDEKDGFELKRDFVEYMASFWNPEGVSKIKESRASSETHAFANDQEFERQIIEEDYKNNPYVQAIMNIQNQRNANNQKTNEEGFSDSIIKLPTNLKFLKDYDDGG